ncbi:MAG TPA: C25 family peptidase propeptide domain-containing protein, partial [Candidatus Cloacimonadota bacterium]|nr:C25 family peptidase propeptide domain-containing protein [Candidatus Cloacimonadota bacterium]
AVGVPVDGDIGIQIISSQFTTLRNVNLMPAERMVLDGEEVKYEFYQDPKVYNTNNPYPAQIVEKGESAFIGDRRFIPLRIRPFQYKALAKELIVYDKIRIRVDISGTKESTKNFTFSSNPIDAAADAFFINNASSKNWRLPRQRDYSYESPKNSVNGVNAIQLIVDQDGIYKVDRAFLQEIIDTETELWGVEMAWDLATVDPRRLELKDKNGSVPIHFVGEQDGRFNHTDHFEFYGRRNAGENSYMDLYTQENVYTLYLKDSFGARMAVENGGLVQSNPSFFIIPDAFESTVHFEEQLIRDKLGKSWTGKGSRELDRDTWFWKRITAPDLELIPFELEYPIGGVIRTASAKVVLQGLTYMEGLPANQQDHEATVRINQGIVNTHRWVGQTEQVFVNQEPIPNSFLRHGTNNLIVSLSGNTPMGDKEQILLDYFELKYWREYNTVSDRLLFTKPSNRPGGLYQFELGGFSSGEVSVYKVGSSVFSNMQIEPFDLDGMAPWSVTLQDSVASTEVQYYACTEDQKMNPKFGRLDISSDLKNPQNQADIVIISRRDLLYNEGTDMIVDLYESEGHSVARVDFQDILDE